MMTAKNLKVMYVEDEEDIRAIAGIALEHVGGFQVELCDSGAAALKRAGEFRPDIIIVDVMMPGMDGVETMAALKLMPQVRTVPIVFMTAKVQRSEIEQYLTAGAAAVIPKPFDPMRLAEEVRRIWQRHKYFDPGQAGHAEELSSAAADPPAFPDRVAHAD